MLAQIVGSSLLATVLLGASTSHRSPAPLSVVHYHQNGRLISLPVRVNASKLLDFVFDTGAIFTAVDSAAAKQLKLHIFSSDRGGGVGRGTFTQQHAAPIDLSIGSITMHVAHPSVVDLRNTGTHDPLAGLLGPELLAMYVVRIDPVAKTLALYDRSTFVYGGQGAEVPLISERNRLFLTMRLTVDSGKSVTSRMRLDTGSEDAASDNLVRESSQRRKTIEGVGLGTPYVDYSGVFQTVQIGPYVIHNAWGPSNDRPSVGMEVMRRFTMTFDLPRGHLYLEPNRYFREPVPAPG